MQVTSPIVRRALLGCAVAFAFGVAHAQTFDANPNATLTYFDPVGNETLDPRSPQNGSSFAQGMMMAIYDQLVLLDAKGEPRPSLAESWSYNADLTEFTMKLRKGVVFQCLPFGSLSPIRRRKEVRDDANPRRNKEEQ